MSLDQSDTAHASTDTFLTALVFNGAVFAAQILAFTLLRPYFRRIYEPRAIRKLIGPLAFFWPIQVVSSDYRAILKENGPDAYFFVRFLRMMTRIFLPIWIVSWGVLLPITSVGTNVGTNTGLDRFVFGNVEPDKRVRYAAHIILVYLFTGTFCGSKLVVASLTPLFFSSSFKDGYSGISKAK
jgi:calcium permeable stress-gated cation channel